MAEQGIPLQSRAALAVLRAPPVPCRRPVGSRLWNSQRDVGAPGQLLRVALSAVSASSPTSSVTKEFLSSPLFLSPVYVLSSVWNSAMCHGVSEESRASSIPRPWPGSGTRTHARGNGHEDRASLRRVYRPCRPPSIGTAPGRGSPYPPSRMLFTNPIVDRLRERSAVLAAQARLIEREERRLSPSPRWRSMPRFLQGPDQAR